MFSSVTSSVTNWFGKQSADDTEPGQAGEPSPQAQAQSPVSSKEGQEKPKTEAKAATDDATNSDSVSEAEKGDKEKEIDDGETTDGEKKSDIDIDLDEMSAKAVNAAKEWGSYLFNVGKAATSQVAKTAKQLKDTVEEKTFMGEFHKEQNKFVEENRDKKKQSEAAVPPWVGYNEEEAMKTQILALSGDQRNFLRNPPAGVQFQFDYQTSYPVAMAMLTEDPQLNERRFQLVPKQVNEETFWRNYFYRVSLIKQSAQLTTLAQQTGSAGDTQKSEDVRTSDKSQTDSPASKPDKEPEDLPTASPPDHEFISDAFQTENLSEEDLKQEMQQLGMTDDRQAGEKTTTANDDIPEWERELQAELEQEYEVVGEGADIADADLEKELMQQIEDEAKGQS